ncbi:cytochrome c biogenesis protein CcsA [Thiomicrorhabdus sp. zzn3]|uniref:cytochrome C assembly family protein n=1 Tax=Thiomicrorhabdus sp. zzn3 TaxID=3039775 RepID=UPI0024369ECB|nr:cytochrome c biogenesis protein CcsA [Thiomicrorhabdus sp. zzn3]MDG6777443.1 cytochrome c biogenesis protein CcsA [Thiomicrorhabdus sp. zzn3]
MITSGFSALFASLLYLYASFLLWHKIQTQKPLRNRILGIAVIAIALHAISLNATLAGENEILFGFGNGLSLIAWLASSILLITNFNKETDTLGIFIFPLAALTTLLPFGLTDTHPLPYELGSHVLISISAYSIMGLATAQAILYSIQERRFRKKQLSTLLRALPPLQIMEKTLIQLIVIGFVFLSFALLSGVFFIENLFAQHLVHKTFFAILAWSIYAIFLLGHFQRGWRGQKAAKYSIWAYGFLILSYIGTELVFFFMQS